MALIVLAILMTSMSALTGIIAIGNGRHWNFQVRDYFRGKRNAVIYAWVIASSIFSICHSGSLLEYGIRSGWTLHPQDARWMVIHSIVGALFSFAHLFVASTLGKEIGPRDKYLWGNRRAV